MEGIALAPQARATEGGQSASKSSVNVLPPTMSSYTVCELHATICIAYISCDDGVNLTWFERHYIIVRRILSVGMMPH